MMRGYHIFQTAAAYVRWQWFKRKILASGFFRSSWRNLTMAPWHGSLFRIPEFWNVLHRDHWRIPGSPVTRPVMRSSSDSFVVNIHSPVFDDLKRHDIHVTSRDMRRLLWPRVSEILQCNTVLDLWIIVYLSSVNRVCRKTSTYSVSHIKIANDFVMFSFAVYFHLYRIDFNPSMDMCLHL